MSFNIFQGLYNNEDAPKELKYIKNQVSLNTLSLDIKYDYYPYYIKIKQLDNPYDDELSIATNNYEKKFDTFIYDEKNLQIKWDIDFNKAVVGSHEYPDIKKVYEELVKFMDEKIVLKKI